MSKESQCPFTGSMRQPRTDSGTTLQDWWPNRLKLELLHQHSAKSNPMGADFDYAKEFRSSTWRR